MNSLKNKYKIHKQILKIKIMSTQKQKFETLQVHAGHTPDQDTLSRFTKRHLMSLKILNMQPIFLG